MSEESDEQYIERVREKLDVVRELGLPLPLNDVHAISVSLPKWDHVVGYEKGCAEVVDAMQSGYPRFRFHNAVRGVFLTTRAIYCLERAIAGSLSSVNMDELCSAHARDTDCLAFPGLAVAQRFKRFMEASRCNVNMFKFRDDGIVVAVFPARHSVQAKKYWQHSGEILSSRAAQELLVWLGDHVTVRAKSNEESEQISLFDLFMKNALRPKSPILFLRDSSQRLLQNISTQDLFVHRAPCPAELAIRRRIASIMLSEEDSSTQNVLLAPSGMAAIFSAFRLIRKSYESQNPSSPMHTVVFGFPYLDTLKMLQRKEWSDHAHFLGNGGEDDLQRLAELLESSRLSSYDVAHGRSFGNRVGAIFTEFSSNPLLKCADLARLTDLCAEYGVVLVVDDTIAGFANVDLFCSAGAHAAVLVSSLSKSFSGRGNVLAGSLVLNPRAAAYSILAVHLAEMVEERDFAWMHAADLEVLERNSRGYVGRCLLMNANAATLARYLQSQRCVQNVHYPGLGDGDEHFVTVMRPTLRCTEDPSWVAGFGCLLSFELREGLDTQADCAPPSLAAPAADNARCTQAFFDALPLNKGPSLGTEFTLVCPYTLLAHYHELPWAAKFGVPTHLLRVSVGSEDIQSLLDAFDQAFEAVQAAVL